MGKSSNMYFIASYQLHVKNTKISKICNKMDKTVYNMLQKINKHQINSNQIENFRKMTNSHENVMWLFRGTPIFSPKKDFYLIISDLAIWICIGNSRTDLNTQMDPKKYAFCNFLNEKKNEIFAPRCKFQLASGVGS